MRNLELGFDDEDEEEEEGKINRPMLGTGKERFGDWWSVEEIRVGSISVSSNVGPWYEKMHVRLLTLVNFVQVYGMDY